MIDFRYPLVLFCYLLLIGIMIIKKVKSKDRSFELSRWGEEKLRTRLFSRIDMKLVRRKSLIQWWGIFFLIFSASGPRIGTSLKEIESKGVDILVALDISKSMLAEDVKPTRLEKSKLEISRLISRLEGDRIGLVVFAGTSFVFDICGDCLTPIYSEYYNYDANYWNNYTDTMYVHFGCMNSSALNYDSLAIINYGCQF